MYTSCPACGTIVDVTTETLGSSDGAAYCDVCQAPFSALKNLARDAGDARPSAVAADLPTSKKRRRGRRGGRRKKKPTITPIEQPSDGSATDPTETTETIETTATSPGLRWAAILLAACAALGLTHINRERLADLPIVGPAVLGSYAALGHPLAPRWELSGYTIRGSSELPSGPGTLQVKALIENTASSPQPPPLLRVVLQDAFGAALARRDLTPADYLGGAAAMLLPSGGRVTATVTLSDVSPQVVGFELDLCLESSGRVRCQNDGRPATTP
jgi:Protein of unknown function (DUF3426)